MAQKLLNGMADMIVCLTLCLDIMGRCSSTSEALHARD